MGDKEIARVGEVVFQEQVDESVDFRSYSSSWCEDSWVLVH